MAHLVFGPTVSRRGNKFTRWFWYSMLRTARWDIEGDLLNLSRTVLIGAPHTSNWDFVLGMAVKWGLGLEFRWIGKHTLFRGPFGILLRLVGGIPVDREEHQGLVSRAIELFSEEPQLLLVITPEGTRRRVERWKTGFYHIAVGANVSIVCAYLDYPRRRVGFTAPFKPTGNMEADIQKLRGFYEPYRRTGKRPEFG